jgi:hypothetical protein
MIARNIFNIKDINSEISYLMPGNHKHSS